LKEFNQLSDCIGFYEEVQGYVDPKINNAVNEAKYLRENAILKKGSNNLQPGTFTSRANASNVLHSSNNAFLILLLLNQKLFELLDISKSTPNTPDRWLWLRAVAAPIVVLQNTFYMAISSFWICLGCIGDHL